MKFSTHQRRLAEGICVALGKHKAALIADFQYWLAKAGELFPEFDARFWLEQLGRHSTAEIAMTRFGHSLAVSEAGWFTGLARNDVPPLLESMCTNLFTYCHLNESCEMQADFHYYYSEHLEQVFRQSTFGSMDPDVHVPEGTKVRIALVSELIAFPDEWYC